MSWFRRKTLNSVEYEDLLARILKVFEGLKVLGTDVQLLETSQRSLRGFINRRVGSLGEEKIKNPHVMDFGQEIEKIGTETNLKPNIFLNPNGDPI